MECHVSKQTQSTEETGRHLTGRRLIPPQHRHNRPRAHQAKLGFSTDPEGNAAAPERKTKPNASVTEESMERDRNDSRWVITSRVWSFVQSSVHRSPSLRLQAAQRGQSQRAAAPQPRQQPGRARGPSGAGGVLHGVGRTGADDLRVLGERDRV